MTASATDTGLNQIYLDNMRALWRNDPRLAHKIDELDIDASLEVQPSKSGPPTASVLTKDGRKLFLHSRYDPQREAREFCEGLGKDEVYAVIVSGLGLGYHVKALIEAFGNEIVIVVSEPDLVTIKTALEHTDLTAALRSGRTEILTTLDKDLLHTRLERHSAMLMLGTVFAVPPVARDVNAEFHNACRDQVMDYAAFARMTLLTLVRNAGLTCRNIANNLPAYVASPPADLVRYRFVGKPAILVAAGPSLAKNIDQLQGLQDKAVIIAAQTTLRMLLDRGIRPHFVTSLDYSPVSRQFFEDVDLPQELVLVAEPKASWHVIDAYRGSPGTRGRRLMLLDNTFAHECLGDALAKRTPMEPGATVMHLAFYLAQWLGCDPIIFIGQDLAFGGHCYYAPGVAMHRAWESELGAFCTLEMKEWERVVRQRELLRKVKDHAGRDIYTDEQMFTYLEQFERDFAHCSSRVIDATEGGAKKAGAQVVTLADAAKSFCAEPLARSHFEYMSACWYDASKLRPARDMLVARRDELAAFRAVCEETRNLLVEMTSLVDKPDRFNRCIVRVDELRTLVQQHGIIFRMVRDVSQLGELQKFAADRKLAADTGRESQQKDADQPKRERARARRQLKRDANLIDSLLDGCDSVQNMLNESIVRFDAEMEAAQ